MKKKLIYISALSVLVLITLLAFYNKESTTEQPPHKNEKINLALRQTAHLLLKQAGDSTSRIAPIKNESETVFVVNLERHFNYDSLPIFLNRSLSAHQIPDAYDVSVWDCRYQQLILGYSSLDFSQKNDVPCMGRVAEEGCYNFKVVFKNESPKSASFPFAAGLAAISLAVLGFSFGWHFSKNKVKMPVFEENTEGGILPKNQENEWIKIGKTQFDLQKQTINTAEWQQKLTYREAKLLHFFCQHPNELLERDVILKAVWEDEGIMVGRSLDVFVSRLRKLIQNDASLKLTSVHGRGYKLEVVKD